jgi:hypothetical protein
MDASDIIKRMRDSTMYNNIQAQFSTAQLGCRPGQPNTTCIYQFSNYDARNSYFTGRYGVSLYCSTCVNVSTICFS